MSSSWGCPHEINDACAKVKNLPCDPGMKGCVLAGRFLFTDEEKNARLRKKMARASEEGETARPPEDPEPR